MHAKKQIAKAERRRYNYFWEAANHKKRKGIHMIKKTHILSIILCIAMVLSFIPRQEVSAKSKKVSVTKSLTLKVGQSKSIKVKGSYIKSKKYKTSKKRIATVSKKGKVTAKKAGTCKITVTVKYKKSKKAKKYTTKKYTCKVTVTKKATTVPTKQPVTAKPTNNNIKPTPTPIPTKEPVPVPTEQPDKPTATDPVQTQNPTVTGDPAEPTTEPTGSPSGEECEHVIGDTWSVVTEPEYNKTSEMTPICKKCGQRMGSEYQISFSYEGDTYTYTQWNQEPSETQEGILDVYQGIDVSGMTEEEIASKYEKYNVVFYKDGRKDTFYGKWINNAGEPTDNRDEAIRFGVFIKSTTTKLGSIKYPKYEVKTIDLGNGQTTKVYGYYDREMANEVFNMVNEYRVENGLNELDHNDITQNFADIRSPETFYTYIYNQQNTDYEYKPHERPNKTMPDTVIKDIAYNGFGENSLMHTIIEDYQAGGILQKVEMTPENIMQSFKDSFEHNSIMLDPEFTDLSVSIFIGYPQNKDGTFKSYKVGIPVQSFMH